jgi:hypothetical protein
MGGRLVFETKFGVGDAMSSKDRASTDRNGAWEELRQLVGAGGPPRQKTRDFWEEIFGSEDALLYDGEGNDRTDLFRALIERLDQTTRIAEGLAERVAVLERLAVQDEARIALEIEKLRHAKDHS